MTPKNIKARTAIEYFNKGYYHSGKWLGKGAEALGLKGEITDIQVYENIIKGLSLDGTQKLTAREVHEDKRKAAVDCTFAAPKSFSYCALVLGDSRLLAAHNKVLEEKVLPLMEARYAQTRVMFDGKTQEVVKTGNMVIAKYDHFESRELDFHVHSHCLVMNTTQMPNGEWYSHLNDGIFTHQKVLGMAYQHGLAKEVQKLGYEIEWRDHGQFEIKGLTEQQRMNFSKRRQQILASAGVDASWSERERVWKKTRRNKELVPLVELQKRWREEAQALGMPIITPNQPEFPVNHLELEQPQPELELKIFNDAIAHCSEKRVAFRAEDLEKFILEHSKQAVDITKIQSGIDNNAELIKLDEATEIRYTTQTAVLRELATNKMMQQGQRSLRSITHPKVVEHHLAQTKLNQGQRQAVMLALTTNDQVIGWQGVAGAGKTYALEQVKALAEASNYVVKGLAPSAKASRILGKELKSPTQTVARFLNSNLPVQIQPNQIWAVDEAGLLSAKDCHRLLKRARQERARIILVGDTKQLSAVEAGAPFKSLQQAGLIAADSTIGKESFYVAASRAKRQVCFFTEAPKRLLQWAQHSKAQENPVELLRQQLREEMGLLQAGSVKSSSAQSQVAVMEKPRLRNKVINEKTERLEAKLVGQQPINQQHSVKPKEQINDFNTHWTHWFKAERTANGREGNSESHSTVDQKDFSVYQKALGLCEKPSSPKLESNQKPAQSSLSGSTSSTIEPQLLANDNSNINQLRRTNEPLSAQQPGTIDGASIGRRTSERLNTSSRATRPHRGLDSHLSTSNPVRVAANSKSIVGQAELLGTQTSPRIRANSDRLREFGIKLRDELRNTECSQQTADRTTERVVERSGAANTTTRRSFNRAGEINRAVREHRESVKALTNSLRELPLEDVAARLGLKIDRHDKHKWKGEGQIISINAQKFYDHLAMKGGYGAIDLVMHAQGRNFKQAVDWLSNGVSYTPPLRENSHWQKAPSRERQLFQPPIADESKWLEVKHYLVEKRGLPEQLVDELHSTDKVYASGADKDVIEKLHSQGRNGERITNAVFLRHNEVGEVTGASLRGVSDNSQFKGLATGTHRDGGWFSLSQGEGQLKRIVLVESAIDALSAAALAKQKTGTTMFIATDGAGSVPTALLQQHQAKGGQVIVAYDNNSAGEQMAQRVIEALPGAIRVKPSYGKDWNEQLIHSITNNEAIETAQAVRVLLNNFVSNVKTRQPDGSRLFESANWRFAIVGDVTTITMKQDNREILKVQGDKLIVFNPTPEERIKLKNFRQDIVRDLKNKLQQNQEHQRRGLGR